MNVRWRTLGLVAPERLVDPRVQLHYAAQAVASVGKALAPPEPDFGHASLEWLTLASDWVAKDSRRRAAHPVPTGDDPSGVLAGDDPSGALAGRPGRIDQAIEVPLPDETGRGKLARLYGEGLPLVDAVVAEAARRSEGTSCAFIKELMRRLAQASLARDRGNSVISADIDEALDDMLFSGGRLNGRLLGGAQQMATG